MKLIKLINPENVSEEEASKYPVREAARAIVVDSEGNFALLHVVNNNHYKIPGGGIENGEDRENALKRECLEEIGCEIEVTGEVGMIIEYRKIFNLKQISYCYSAKLKGEKGQPNLMPDEIESGFTVEWLPKNDAIKAFSESEATTEEGRLYMVPRDAAFLENI